MTDGPDVRWFDRLARPYELAVFPAREGPLRAGLAVARGEVRRALDVGGGTGRAARALPELDVTVVDAARGMLRTGRRRGVAGVQGDAARLPVRDAAVDAVLVVDALHHFHDRRGALGEAARALRPGGVLVVREFDPTTRRGRALAFAEHLVGFDSQFFAPAALVAALEAAGLAPVVVERGFGYTVAGRKR